MLESNANAKADVHQHETYVKTFISIGRHRNALNYLDGLMTDKPEWRDTLDSYRIEACWKLGSWDKLKQIVSTNTTTSQAENAEVKLKDDLVILPKNGNNNAKSSDLFNVIPKSESNNPTTAAITFNASVGKLFSLVIDRDEARFHETLRVLREQQIGPLSAASMEAGGNAYQRGYEYVVNLQILQEIECSLAEMLQINSTTEKVKIFQN